MDIITERLSCLQGGRVLDLATGSGAFARRLAEGLATYEELVAVDSAPRAVETAAQNLSGLRAARVELADAGALPYPDARFNLVGIANSLHHLREPKAVLAEALRVLAPGGHLVVLEMHREAGEDATDANAVAANAAMTHVLLHHWWGAIDRAGGLYHAETFDRATIRALMCIPRLEEVSVDELEDDSGDPRDPDTLAEIEAVIAQYRAKVAALPPGAATEAERGELAARGEKLLERARTIGFRSAPSMLCIGRKI